METTAGRPAEVGALVRRARREQGLTQADLARLAGVGRQWLVELEAGNKASCPLDMLMRLLAVLDLEVTLDPSAHTLEPTSNPLVDNDVLDLIADGPP